MIRPIVPADTDALVALTDATKMFRAIEIKALREVLNDYHADNHADGHLAVTIEVDGESQGFAYYAPVPMADRTWQLWWIVVRKDTQGKGIGGKLLRFVEDDIRGRNGRLLFIETGSVQHYDLTRQFYHKHGYEQHALLRDFYADGDSMVVFRKLL